VAVHAEAADAEILQVGFSSNTVHKLTYSVRS